MLVFLPGKMRSDHHKNHGCGQKKPEGTNFAIFGMGPLQIAANSTTVLTEFAAEPTTKMIRSP